MWIEGESKPRIALSLRPEIKVDPNKKSIVDKFLSTILTQNYRDNPLMPFRILWNQATIQEELRLLVERRSFKNENDPYPLSIAVPSTER